MSSLDVRVRAGHRRRRDLVPRRYTRRRGVRWRPSRSGRARNDGTGECRRVGRRDADCDQDHREGRLDSEAHKVPLNGAIAGPTPRQPKPGPRPLSRDPHPQACALPSSLALAQARGRGRRRSRSTRLMREGSDAPRRKRFRRPSYRPRPATPSSLCFGRAQLPTTTTPTGRPSTSRTARRARTGATATTRATSSSTATPQPPAAPARTTRATPTTTPATVSPRPAARSPTAPTAS